MDNSSKSPPEANYKVKNALVNYYLLMMFTVFPLFFTQKYSNIRHDKYYLFLTFSALISIVEFMMYLSSTNSKELITKGKWYKTLSFTDVSMIVLLLCYTLSTILSDWKIDSVTGNQGRNNGLLLMAVYVAVYFVITREYKFYEYIFGALAVSSGIVFLLAVINYFYIDPLGMFVGYEQQYVIDFSSTIGNKNLMASFVCICLPVLIMLFMNTKNKKLRWLYYGVSVLGFSALLVADSDSGFLGVFAILLILLIYYIRKPKMLSMFFFSIFSMLLGAKLLRLFSFAMNDYSKGFSSIPYFFIYENAVSYVIIAAAGLLALLFFFISKEKPGLIFPKAVFLIALGIVITGFAFAVYLFIKYTFIDTTAPLNEIMSYFRFNDKWGTHRGYMWRISMEIFSGFNIKDMLFGCGPDTYYSVFQPYFGELFTLYGDGSTNCAHNEYLNYLVTTGILGLFAYLCVIVGFIVRAVKAAKTNPFAMVCCAGVVCYAIQAVVNIAQPITTPMFILLLCIGEAFCRQTVKRKNLKT
ncbi:MAG: O-antigen ligase family protein [Oscillospiraceae bacterium]|nr:O-antigen ligase family protein [Oscillospiraceae bacterium]